ncbi:alpha/beta hydrolase [Nocardia sp. NBC_01503]|uniref:alpha/beta fold hydrolase n=1 Tax=Nocardia sp. NBC_01503 TaxID=2975997 RepID=UPI002E7C12FD|nr:alpha/beta fold hydrolase [Nocardia sp. NBC_01503]WTL34580.1 alpha/beta hydrolase [Nocardia sp. NBC_01503]
MRHSKSDRPDDSGASPHDLPDGAAPGDLPGAETPRGDRRTRRRLTIGAGILTGIAAVVGAVLVTPIVPSAEAEPALDGFYNQQPQWKSCDEPRLDKAGAQCADITVPLNYAAPRGETITVAISRIAATDTANRRGIILSNPGGPGGPGLDFGVDFGAAMTPEVKARYDLIGMDPRGIGRSSAVHCGWPRGFGLQSAGVDAVGYAESVATQTELAARCATTNGERLRYFTTRNTARDMDVIRGVLGEQKTSYYGTSYGTYLGAVYTEMFPERADRIVLDSAVDPARYGAVEMMRDMGVPNEAALDDWADSAAAKNAEYHLGGTREQVRATVMDLIRRSAEKPIRVGEFDVDEHALPMMLFTVLDDPRQYDVVSDMVRLFADAADGKPVNPDPGIIKSLAYMLKADPADGGAQMAIMCGDVEVPRDPAWYWRNIEAARATEPVFGAFANNITPCAFWAPPVEAPTVVNNSVPALIVQSTGDTRTSYGNAQGMHRALSASRMVTLENVAIHWIFGRYPNSCVYAAVNDYFRDGTLPANDMTCQRD